MTYIQFLTLKLTNNLAMKTKSKIIYVGFLIIIITIICNLYLITKGNVPSKINFDFLLWMFFYLFYYLWVSLPYLLMWLLLKKHANSTTKTIINIIVILGMSIYGLSQMVRTTIYHLDPQSAIATMFIPLYQLTLLGGIFLVLVIVYSFIDKKQ